MTKCRARRLGGIIAKDRKDDVINLFYDLANKLSLEIGQQYVVDHIIDLGAGGKHHEDNLQIITQSDNIWKAKNPGVSVKGIRLKEVLKFYGR